MTDRKSNDEQKEKWRIETPMMDKKRTEEQRQTERAMADRKSNNGQKEQQ